MISSFLFVPIETNFHLLKKKNKNNFSISFHFMFLIPWIGIIDVVSITDVLIIFLDCEPAYTSMIHSLHFSQSLVHSLLSFRLFMRTSLMMCLFFYSCYILSDNFVAIINFMIELSTIYFIIPIWIPSCLIILSNVVHVNSGPNNVITKRFPSAIGNVTP